MVEDLNSTLPRVLLLLKMENPEIKISMFRSAKNRTQTISKMENNVLQRKKLTNI